MPGHFAFTYAYLLGENPATNNDLDDLFLKEVEIFLSCDLHLYRSQNTYFLRRRWFPKRWDAIDERMKHPSPSQHGGFQTYG